MNLICRFICIVYINVKSYGASYFQLRSSLNLDDRVHKANIFFCVLQVLVLLVRV